MAKYFYQWALERKYVRLNPFSNVKPIGKRSAGKEQLRVDEARHFTEILVQACEQQERGAIAVLTQLFLGLRSSEVLTRHVRDLDDEGAILWIPAGKTENARRRLEVPEVLRPFLVRLAAGKGPDDLLFETQHGRPHDSTWLWRHVKRYCERAHVPVVCAHSLRGLHSTLAVGAGCTSGAVAAALGHGSFSITAKHYVAPGALKQAGVHRVAEALTGAPTGPSEATALLERLRALSPADRSAILHTLDAATERKAP
jgi:integrase